MDKVDDINYSPLCKEIISEGRLAKVFIFKHKNSDWKVKIDNEQNKSFIWKITFASDQDALEHINSVLENEGIEALYC